MIKTGTESLDWLFGKSHSDTLFGLGHIDTLNGRGGRDYLSGGDGDDHFKFVQADLRDNGWDYIMDWECGDRIQIGGGSWNVDPDQFVYGKHAEDENDRVIYNCDTGVLKVDRDGQGGHKALKVAIVLSDDGRPAYLDHGDVFLPGWWL